jgi:hypothetical protein
MVSVIALFLTIFVIDATVADACDVCIRVVNEADVSRQVLDEAQTEASAIWASAGVHVRWSSSHRPAILPDHCRLVTVVVRRTLTRPRLSTVADSQASSLPVLGRIIFDEQGQPGNLIEVSLSHLTRTVMSGSVIGVPVSDLPMFVQMTLLGRGLGRVVAHEIGHWFSGRGHTHDGLMQASFGSRELLAQTSPALAPVR